MGIAGSSNGGTLVPSFWPIFLGVSPYIGLNKGLIYGSYLQWIGSWDSLWYWMITCYNPAITSWGFLHAHLTWNSASGFLHAELPKIHLRILKSWVNEEENRQFTPSINDLPLRLEQPYLHWKDPECLINECEYAKNIHCYSRIPRVVDPVYLRSCYNMFFQ